MKKNLKNQKTSTDENNVLVARRSFHSYYAIFEIQEKGMIKMLYTKNENEDENTFETREKAIEWLVNYAFDFKRYFILEQIIVY